MIDLTKHKLKLQYPCSWCYKIIIEKEHNANMITKNILQSRIHQVSRSKISSKGKFKSYNIDLIVNDSNDRENLHKLFSEHQNVKMVI
jgi:putative lipoic acid-binding regulatory protein